jgi:peptide deformylase
MFIDIERPRKCVMKYEDKDGNTKEAHLDGMMSRICQHEYDHTIGRNFTEGVSKIKLDMAKKKAMKQIKRMEEYRKFSKVLEQNQA